MSIELKAILKKITPQLLLRYYDRFKQNMQQRSERNKTSEEVFTKIYKGHKWGRSEALFDSGAGSKDEKTVSAYTSIIYSKASSEGFLGLTFVDLGCGNFNVGKQLLPLCSKYIGVDVVKPLILFNQKEYGNEATNFKHLDIVKDELPDGDVCFMRQVLQHMSNQQIGAVLMKIKKYRWVFITEHHPTDNDAIKPNLDKIHGVDIRADQNSGVYLTEPPFSLPPQAIEQVLEVAGVGLGEENDRGVIRTFLYKPKG